MPKRRPQDESTEEHLIINVDTEEHHTEETKSTIPVLNSDEQDVSEQETPVSEEVSEAPAPKSLTVTKELLERMKNRASFAQLQPTISLICRQMCWKERCSATFF